MNAKECVERGSRLLDEKVPGWRERVKSFGPLDGGDMGSCTRCVVGRLFGHATGSYDSGVRELFGVEYVFTPDSLRIAAEHGFMASSMVFDGVADANWDQLAEAWTEELAHGSPALERIASK